MTGLTGKPGSLAVEIDIQGSGADVLSLLLGESRKGKENGRSHEGEEELGLLHFETPPQALTVQNYITE
jgi:hypothetical protein